MTWRHFLARVLLNSLMEDESLRSMDSSKSFYHYKTDCAIVIRQFYTSILTCHPHKVHKKFFEFGLEFISRKDSNIQSFDNLYLVNSRILLLSTKSVFRPRLEIVMNELQRFKHSADFFANSSHIIESAAISASYLSTPLTHLHWKTVT
jgi:hypothetical protein